MKEGEGGTTERPCGRFRFETIWKHSSLLSCSASSYLFAENARKFFSKLWASIFFNPTAYKASFERRKYFLRWQALRITRKAVKVLCEL